MGTRNRIAKTKVLEQDGIATGVKWMFDDGVDVVFELCDLSHAMAAMACAHGIKQKGSDEYAGEKDVKIARGLLEAVLDSVRNGEWTKRISGLVVQALARCTGKSMDAAQKVYDSMDQKGQKALEKHPDIIVAMKEIQLERAKGRAKGTDTPDLTELFG